eukprot:m.196324 g.196324  ORF g.196324 m.196324 type:complete len:401 (-) comp13675_c0_seq5:2808-4010(-)
MGQTYTQKITVVGPLFILPLIAMHEVACALLCYGADASIVNNVGDTPLSLWGPNCSKEVVSLLQSVEKGTLSLLHLASDLGIVDRVKALVKDGENPQALDADRNTPVHIAASHGHLEVVQFLAEQQDQNESDHVALKENSYGETPLELAVKNHHDEVLEYFAGKVTDAVRIEIAAKRLKESVDEVVSSKDEPIPTTFSALQSCFTSLCGGETDIKNLTAHLLDIASFQRFSFVPTPNIDAATVGATGGTTVETAETKFLSQMNTMRLLKEKYSANSNDAVLSERETEEVKGVVDSVTSLLFHLEPAHNDLQHIHNTLFCNTDGSSDFSVSATPQDIVLHFQQNTDLYQLDGVKSVVVCMLCCLIVNKTSSVVEVTVLMLLIIGRPYAHFSFQCFYFYFSN